MFKFFGSKMLLAGDYPPPQHGHLIEPFAGSAAYAVHHRRDVDTATLIDADERIVNLWRRLLAMDERELEDMPVPAVGEKSTDLLIALAAGRTTGDTPLEFTVTFGMAERFDSMRRRIVRALPECRHFTVIHGDYTDAPEVTATWFIDPPYRSAGEHVRWDRTRGGRYRHSNRDIDYTNLGQWARARTGQVIACEQDGADWLPFDRHLRAHGLGGRTYREVFWSSEPVTGNLPATG